MEPKHTCRGTYLISNSMGWWIVLSTFEASTPFHDSHLALNSQRRLGLFDVFQKIEAVYQLESRQYVGYQTEAMAGVKTLSAEGSQHFCIIPGVNNMESMLDDYDRLNSGLDFYLGVCHGFGVSTVHRRAPPHRFWARRPGDSHSEEDSKRRKGRRGTSGPSTCRCLTVALVQDSQVPICKFSEYLIWFVKSVRVRVGLHLIHNDRGKVQRGFSLHHEQASDCTSSTADCLLNYLQVNTMMR